MQEQDWVTVPLFDVVHFRSVHFAIFGFVRERSRSWCTPILWSRSWRLVVSRRTAARPLTRSGRQATWTTASISMGDFRSICSPVSALRFIPAINCRHALVI